MNNVWIVGAGGFGVDIALRFTNDTGENNVFRGFIDSRKDVLQKANETFLVHKPHLKIEYSTIENIDFSKISTKLMFGTGDPLFKKNFFNQNNIKYEQFHMFNLRTNLHKKFIMPGIYFDCLISSQAKVGYANFIDTFSIISHGCKIGDFNHIGINVTIGGNVTIGDCNVIHSGAIIGQNVKIGNNCIIGAGAIVLRDLPDSSKIIAPKSIKLS